MFTVTMISSEYDYSSFDFSENIEVICVVSDIVR